MKKIDEQWVILTRQYEEKIRAKSVKELMNTESIVEMRYCLRVALDYLEQIIKLEI